MLQDTPPSCACPSCASGSQAAALRWLVPTPPTGAASRALSPAPHSWCLFPVQRAHHLEAVMSTSPGVVPGQCCRAPRGCFAQAHLVQPPCSSTAT